MSILGGTMIHKDDWDAMTWKDRYYATRDEACRIAAIGEQADTFEQDWFNDDDELLHYLTVLYDDIAYPVLSIIRRVGKGEPTSADEVAISEDASTAARRLIREAAQNRAETMI